LRRVENLLRWLNVLVILATFVAYLSPFINPESIWFVSLLGTAYPWLLFGNILMMGVWILLKKKYFLFSLTCIILGWNHFNGFIGLHFGSSKSGAQPINIMTYNTQKFPYMKSGYRIIDEPKSKEVFRFMQTGGNPDILCVQEIDDFHVPPIMDHFGFNDFYKIKYYGTAIFSKFPILEKGRIKFDRKVNSCLWTDIVINKQTIRVYSLHLQSNSVSNKTEKVMAEGQFKEKETWSDIRTIFSKFKQTSKIRAQQAKTIAKHIAASPYPVIVCGDFNETPQSYAYRLISENLSDTFKKKGLGLGTTYAGSIPALRIDYILSDENFKITNNHILKKSYSDHYPVISTISIK
jgi:endonuclease/exonuclease/phosphatase family metal-dependent hydrolase